MMILEGVVTTRNADGSTNVAPMGPLVDGEELILRPFSSSTTYANLKAHGEGVFHVTDDVLLIASAAIGTVTPVLTTIDEVAVPRLADCVHWQAFRIGDDVEWAERATIRTQTVGRGRVRDWFGLNRAKHAVIEATILATRVHMLDGEDILQQIDTLRPLVEKTAGPDEVTAFALIEQFVREHGS